MTTPIESVTFADLHWGKLPAGQKIGSGPPCSPAWTRAPSSRWSISKSRRGAAGGGYSAPPSPRRVPLRRPVRAKISIDDFGKVDLRVGLVLSAERVKGADKLMHMKVDIGEAEPRTIVAGIAEAYTPDELVNRKVVIVANLQPRKLRGIESNGMIVAASVEGGKPVLAGFHEEIPVGARLK